MALLGLTATVLVLSGCGSNYLTSSGSTGNVLGTPDGGDGSRKVVTFYVVGKGLEPEGALTRGQAVLMAERAAVADGYRQLVEKLRGVYVDAQLKAGNGTVNYDAIQLYTQSWIRGTEVMELKRADYGITEARMRLRVKFAMRGMVWWPVGIDTDVGPVRTASRQGVVSPGSSIK
ncbi:MAG: hypothetical protein GY737_15850 [Desulfobacteraceae bacterium]|nr:hypothetical protein [Desulfobacteraceae bacterium]